MKKLLCFITILLGFCLVACSKTTTTTTKNPGGNVTTASSGSKTTDSQTTMPTTTPYSWIKEYFDGTPSGRNEYSSDMTKEEFNSLLNGEKIITSGTAIKAICLSVKKDIIVNKITFTITAPAGTHSMYAYTGTIGEDDFKIIWGSRIDRNYEIRESQVAQTVVMDLEEPCYLTEGDNLIINWGAGMTNLNTAEKWAIQYFQIN